MSIRVGLGMGLARMTLQTTTRTKQTTIATKAATGDLSQKDVALSEPGPEDGPQNKRSKEHKTQKRL